MLLFHNRINFNEATTCFNALFDNITKNAKEGKGVQKYLLKKKFKR